MKIATLKLLDFDAVLDVYLTERVPKASTPPNHYYVTPKGLASIEKWAIQSGRIGKKITEFKEFEFFLEQGWIHRYESPGSETA